MFHPLQWAAIANQVGISVGSWTANNATLSAQNGSLKAYWKAEDVRDSVGSHTLTNVGSVTFTSGKRNNSFTLNGSSQYLTALDHVDFEFGSGPVTFSAWVKPSSIAGGTIYGIITKDDNSTNRGFSFDLRAGKVSIIALETASDYSWKTSQNAVTANVWNHVVFTSDGTDASYKLFINSVSQTLDDTGNGGDGSIQATNSDLGIGGLFNGGRYFNGQIDEVAVWKGYEADQTFVTALYNSTVGSYYIGEVSWWGDCVFLTHYDGIDEATTATDISTEGAGSPHTITFFGDAKLTTTLPKFGTTCATFDGNGDYTSTDTSADFNIGSVDFTLDLWIKTTDNINSTVLHCGAGSGAANTNYSFYYVDDGTVGLSVSNGSTYPIAIVSSTSVSDGNWHHVAGTYDGTTYRIFIDGTQENSTTASVSMNNSTFKINIAWNLGGASTTSLDAEIDEVRVVKGTAIWTSNFTPPTAPYNRYE